MSLIQQFQAIVNATKNECFILAKQHDIFLEVDHAGRIWIGDGNSECFRINGWFLTHKKIKEIIKNMELETSGKDS